VNLGVAMVYADTDFFVESHIFLLRFSDLVVATAQICHPYPIAQKSGKPAQHVALKISGN